MKFSNAVSLLALVILTGAANAAEYVRVATFNVGWLFDKTVHDRWTKACASVGWDEKKAASGSAKEELSVLPYCNVHNGLKYPTDRQCPELTPLEILSRPLRDDKNCRETKDLVEWSAYEEKLASLRSMVTDLEKRGVSLIAFQEVFDTASLQQILPAGWSAATSADDAAAPKIPQHVGIAWNSSVHQLQIMPLFKELSDSFDRPLRPGLTFSTHVGGQPTEFLVVHLKSGCRSSRTLINAPSTKNEQDACPALEKQVLALEKWIDDRVGKDFVILGDFNRQLTLEKKTRPNTGSRPDPRVEQIFPELNDNDPEGSKLWIASPRKKLTAEGKEVLDACSNGHKFIDHVMVSNSLNSRMKLGALEYLPITLAGSVAYNAGMTPFVAAPTDHCPHFVELTRN